MIQTQDYTIPLPLELRQYMDYDTKLDPHGYVVAYIPFHPASNREGYVKEHRFVMEQQLGRFLRGREVVHHCDECKTNNHPSNLQLFRSQKSHMLHHQRLAAKFRDPKVIEAIRSAASDPDVSMNDLPWANQTIRKVLQEKDLKWVHSRAETLTWSQVEKAMSGRSRKAGCAILGVSLQTLWNRFPKEMRTIASPKKLKPGAKRGLAARRNASS